MLWAELWQLLCFNLCLYLLKSYTFILKLVFITNSGCLHKELHNLKAVIVLQIDNWVITSFFSKEGEKLTSLILLKGRLKGKKVISAVGWAFSAFLFSTSCCLIHCSVWRLVLNIHPTKHSLSELHLWHLHSIVANHK